MNRVRCLVVGALLILAVTMISAQPAAAQFREMANRLPRTANTLVVVNLQQLVQSPQGVREGWKKRIEGAFQAGMTRVPPQTARFVLGAQLDLESAQPIWEAAVLDLYTNVTMDVIAEKRSGKLDKIGGLAAVALPNDVFVVQFGPRTFGALAPANRQSTVRWLREIEPSSKTTLSPYLEKAAGYSDTAGTDIVMAVDLAGAFSLERTTQYVKKAEALRGYPRDWDRVAKLLAGVEGLRLGIRITEKPLGRVTLDFGEDASVLRAVAKPLLIGMLNDAGMGLDDLGDWKSEVKGTEVSLQGYLTTDSLRRVLSLVESPAPTEAVAETPAKTEAAPEKPSMGELSQAYFKKIFGMLNDLKAMRGGSKTFAQMGVWYGRYAGRIEQLPTLGVDPELVDYGFYAAKQLRAAESATRGANIAIGVNTSQAVNQGGAGDVGGGYGYGYGYGSYGPVAARGVARAAARAEVQYDAAQRRVIRKTGQGEARMSIEGIRDELIAATNETRRRMTDKYQIQF